MIILDLLRNLIEAPLLLTWQNLVMIGAGLVLIYLAIAKEFEPMLLIPIAFGALLANLPTLGIGFMFLLVNIYMMKYATDVLLIAPSAMGIIFGLSRIWDLRGRPAPSIPTSPWVGLRTGKGPGHSGDWTSWPRR